MFEAKVNEIPDKSPKGTLNSGSGGDFVQIDVPGDGSCLFWSVAYAYLMLAEDDNDFHKRYKCLFKDKGIEHSKSFKGQIVNKVLTLEKIIGVDKALIVEFRGKVADSISSNIQLKRSISVDNIFNLFEDNENQRELVCQKFECDLDISSKSGKIEDRENKIKSELNKKGSEVNDFVFKIYLKCVRDDRFWGGDIEIRAMEQMLKLRIGIFNDLVFFYPTGPTDEDFSAEIRLYHINDKTHYNFGLEKSIINKYKFWKGRNIHQQPLPLENIENFPLCQDSTSRSNSPGKENTSPHKVGSFFTSKAVTSSAKRKLYMNVSVDKRSLGEKNISPDDHQSCRVEENVAQLKRVSNPVGVGQSAQSQPVPDEEDVIFYVDSYGEGINKCPVSNLGRGKCESHGGNKKNGSNTPLDKFLEKEGFSKESILDLSLLQ